MKTESERERLSDYLRWVKLSDDPRGFWFIIQSTVSNESLTGSLIVFLIRGITRLLQELS